MPRKTLIQGLTLDRAIAVARADGLDCRDFFRQAGYRQPPETWAGRQVENRLFADFLQWAAQQSRSPRFGLRVGSAFQAGDLGALGYLFLNAPTIAEALAAGARWFAFVQDGGFFQVRRQEAGEVMLLYDGGDLPDGLRQQDAECGLAIIATLIRTAVGARPLEAQVRHAIEDGDRELARHFGCRVQGACPDNALIYDDGFLTRPNRGADPMLFRILSEHVAQRIDARPAEDDLVGLTEWQIGRVLAEGGARLPLVADAMGLSPRTLQRRLMAHGESFASVLDRVRLRALAEQASRPRRKWSDVAAALGFASANALHKWRRRYARANAPEPPVVTV